MPVTEKLTQVEDLYLFEIIKNPILFSEFINNYDKTDTEEPFELTWYQKQYICDFNPYVCMCCGRAVGKTESIANVITWAMVYKLFPDEYYTYHVPSKNNLDPVFNKLVKLFRTNTFLKNFISANSGVNYSDFKISLTNDSVLLCRIAGQTGTGVSVVGLHNAFSIVDEAGYYNYNTFLELLPTLNTFKPGFRLTVSGVPTGLREKNVLYKCDQEDSAFTHHRISALQNPRFSAKDKERAIEQYNGEGSDEWDKYVLGIHGKPVFALFDRSLMKMDNEPVYRLKIDGFQLGSNITEYLTKISSIPGLQKNAHTVLMIDLGYTEPTAIFVMSLDDYDRFHFHAKIEMSKVSYPIQEKIIDRLDSMYMPLFIGIDKGAGGQGISVVQHMMDDREYVHKNFQKRLIPIDFSTSVVVGVDKDGEEIKQKAKPLAVDVLQGYCNNHKIIFSTTDIETIVELERMVYTKTSTGDTVYRTMTERGGKNGGDHFTAALLVGALAYYLQNDFINSRPKKKTLFGAKWLNG